MSRRKNNDTKIELGIVDEKAAEFDNIDLDSEYEDEDDNVIYVERSAIMEEDLSEEETGNVMSSIVIRTDKGSVWVEVAGCGYEISKEKAAPEITKGDAVSVIYQGTPGSSNFMIVGVIK